MSNTPKIAVIDYGVGNLFSLCSSVKYVGANAVITSDEKEIKSCDKILLPGVGAFGDARKKLKDTFLDEIIISEAKSGKSLMGICLGMQLLFEKSYEYGVHDGLSLLKGEIIPMEGKVPSDRKIPHIGWNSLKFTKNSSLFKYIHENDFVYFVHSYYASSCDNSVIAVADYGIDITAAVEYENICGCQFHPEKSGNVGLNILKSFCFD